MQPEDQSQIQLQNQESSQSSKTYDSKDIASKSMSMLFMKDSESDDSILDIIEERQDDKSSQDVTPCKDYEPV